jgi:hypothetical protein
MFSFTEKYIFTGSELNIVCAKQKTRLMAKPIRTSSNNIYLGKYIGSTVLEWGNKRIEKGLAIFENGCIQFPDFRHIQICTEKNINPYFRHSNLYCNLYVR